MSEEKKTLLAKQQHGIEPQFGEETTLCGCLTKPFFCLFSLICPCCAMAANSADLDGQENICLCCYPWGPGKSRVQAISKFSNKKADCADCLIGWLCIPCSETQVHREIQLHSHKDEPTKYCVRCGDKSSSD